MNEKSAAGGPAGRQENDPEENQVRRRAERPKTTITKEAALTLEGRLKIQPTPVQSQIPATRSAVGQNGLGEIQGHRPTESTLIASSGGYPSSMGSDMRSDSPHYLDP